MNRMEEKNCGNCKYHIKESGEWVCDNHDGEYFGLETEYNDKCPDHEGREDG